MGKEVRNMIKKITLPFLVAFLIVLASCTSGSNQQPIGVSPFLGGTKALTLEFGEATLSEIYDNGRQDFSIPLKITNVGEYTIKAASGDDFFRLKLIGFNANEIGATPSDLVIDVHEDIPGRQLTTSGEEVVSPPFIEEFGPFRYLPDLAGSQEINYQVLACYNYETTATTQICIAGDPVQNQVDPNPVCRVNEAKEVFNSGAPVQITELSEGAGPDNKFYLDMKIGVVDPSPDLMIFKDNDNSCDFSTLNYENQNVVYVEVMPSENTNLEVRCRFRDGESDSGYVKLLSRTGPTHLICKVIANGLDPTEIYQTTFKIRLRYVVGEKIENSMRIISYGNG